MEITRKLQRLRGLKGQDNGQVNDTLYLDCWLYCPDCRYAYLTGDNGITDSGG